MAERRVSMSRYTQSDLRAGDWIKYRAPDGSCHYTEIRSFYPFGKEPIADTFHGRIAVSTIVDVRRSSRSTILSVG